MSFNRRCGYASCVVLTILASLFSAPSALSQTLTMVQSTTRSAGSSAAGYNGDFGTAATVSLNNPSYIVFDSNGNQFFSDTLNNCVRKIDTSGNVTTIAGLGVSGQSDTCNSALNATPTPAQGLYQPTGLAIDSSNRLYIADSKHNCVRALFNGQTGVANLTTVAGTCGSDPTVSVTPAPNGLAVDASSNLYISLQDSVSSTNIYQVVQHAAAAAVTNVCLVAGAASANVSTNCPGITNGVVLSGPSGLAMNISGDLYIADTGNNCVRQVAGLASGSATLVTAVGRCLNDASGSSATAISNPYGIAVSPTQSLFISESSPNNVVSYTPGSSTVQLVAGLLSGVAGSYDSTQDGQAAISVPLNGPRGIAFDSMAHLFFADSLNNILRELSTNLRFPNTPVGSFSSVQPITFAINQPVNLSISIGTDYTVSSTTCAGALVPAPSGSTPNTCQIFVRFAPTRPGIRDAALKITDSVSGTSIYQGLHAIGTGALALFTPGAPATIANSLASPATIVTDAAGYAYVLETGATSGTPDIRLIPVSGRASSPAITLTGVATPTAIASDAAGNWYVADATHGTISRFGADGSVNTSYITGLDTPTALYVDAFGNLYIAQAGASHNVIESYISGARVVVAGSGSNAAGDNVPAANASFVSPSAITVNIDGILYIADQGGHFVYAIDNTGTIHIVAGNGTTSTTTEGNSKGTPLAEPTSLATDAAGDLYIAEQTTGNIYVVHISSTNSNDTAVIFNATAHPTPNGPLGIALDGDSNLFISRNATNSVLEISYPNPTVSFGAITIGNTSAVVLQNLTNAGTDTLNITSVYSTTDSHFSVNTSATTCGSTILTGSTCAIGFTFTPTTNISYSAQTIISSNSYNTPQPITLTGVGQPIVTPILNLAPQSEVYGQRFQEIVTFSKVTDAPTGTLTFTTGSQTLCTITGTFTITTTCNAPISGLSVGTYTVTFNYSGDTNYNPTSGIITLTVTPAPLAELVNNANRVVGAPNPAFSGTLTGVVPGETILAAYSTTANATSPVGSYLITATLTAAAPATLSNYSISNDPGTLSITQATATSTLPAQTEVYGQPFTESFTFGGVAAGIPPTGTISFTSSSKTPLCAITGTFGSGANTCNAANGNLPVGTYVVAFNYSGDTNYAPFTGSTTLTVTPAPLTVKVANVSRPYGVANPAFSSTITGAVAGDTFTQAFSTTATITSPVNTYSTADVLSGPAASNYTVTVVPGILTITPASLPLTVAVNSTSRPYGAANPAFASTITGVINGDTFTVTYSTAATLTSPVNCYAITPTVSGPALSNYTLIASPGILNITAAPLTVKANNASRAYGAANPAFTGTTVGLFNGDNVTVDYMTAATINSPVGTDPIVPNVSGAALSNYNLSVINGTLTITANGNSLVINVNSAARVYGTSNPAFSGTVSGVLPGDDVVVIYTTTAAAASSAGNYPIGANVSGTSASNYIATIHPGTLAITAAATTTTITTSAPSALIGGNVTFTANVESPVGIVSGVVNFFDGTVMLGSANLTAAGAATYTTNALSVGTHNISGAFQANTNFNTSGASLTQPIAQAVGAFTISAAPNTPFIKGAGTTLYQVTVTPAGAFTGQVALACSGLPADATCTFAAPTITLTAGTSVTTTMTVTTTVADAKLEGPDELPSNPADLAPFTVATIFPAELTGFGVLFAGLRRRKALGTQKVRLLLLIVFTLGILGLVGCGCPNTVFHTYSINVTGTSLSFPAPAQTISVLLSVGQQ